MTRIGNTLFVSLATLIPAALVAACSGGANTSSTAQEITCTTDPSTGVVLQCASGSGSGGSNECHDMDTDGDGEPHDVDHADQVGTDPNDDDGDGIPNDQDCDEHPGEDHDKDGGQLPYDVRPQLGSTTTPIVDAFKENGGTVPTIVSVSMDGGSWRLAELQAGTAFVVTQDDCNHAGNRDVGRDRVIVTWKLTDGSTDSDHLDIRYCDGGGGGN
jgi:hypothetical protein